MRHLVEPHPERIEHELDHMAAVADPASAQFRWRHQDLLEGPRAAEIDLEGDIDRENVEPEKAEHRPGAQYQEYHAGGETDHAQKRHHQEEAGTIERTVRRQERREQHRLDRVAIKIVACRPRVSVYPDHGENHPSTTRQKGRRSIRAEEIGK